MFVLKGILLGLGLFGICLAIYVVGIARLLLKGAPTPAPGTAIGHRLRDDASAQPLDARCVAGLHHVGAFKLWLVADARRLVVLSCCCLQ